jgi:hypothetical protein
MQTQTPTRQMVYVAIKTLNDALGLIPKADAALAEAEARFRKATEARERFLASGELTDAGRKEFRNLSDECDFAGSALSRAKKGSVDARSALLPVAQGLRETVIQFLRPIVEGLQKQLFNALVPFYGETKQLRNIIKHLPEAPRIAEIRKCIPLGGFNAHDSTVEIWARTQLSIAERALECTED